MVVPALAPDFADLAIANDQRDISLNATVYNVNDVGVGYHERCLGRRRTGPNHAGDS
ncbi:MAG: hypothetical protein ACREF9_21155 [Opitutaceae bacterium]